MRFTMFCMVSEFPWLRCSFSTVADTKGCYEREVRLVYLKQLSGRRTLLGVLCETLADKVIELGGPQTLLL